MTRGSYTLREDVRECEHDTSYKSCLCALLLVLSICLINLIVGMFWTYRIIIEKIHDPKWDRGVVPPGQKYQYEEIVPTTQEIITKAPTTTTLPRTSNKNEFQSNRPLEPTTKYFNDENRVTSKDDFGDTENTTYFENFTTDVNKTSSGFKEDGYGTEGEIFFGTTTSDQENTTETVTITTEGEEEANDEDQTTTNLPVSFETQTTEFSRITEQRVSDAQTIRSSGVEDEAVSEDQTTGSSGDKDEALSDAQTVRSSGVKDEAMSEAQTMRSSGVKDDVVSEAHTTKSSPVTKKIFPEFGTTSVTNTLERLSTVDDRIIFNQSSFENQQLPSSSNLTNGTHTTEYVSHQTSPTTTACIPFVTPGMTTMTTTTPIPATKPEPVCLTIGCKSAASRMLSLMDHSADACEDFYQFACGGVKENSADSNVWTAIEEEFDKIDETLAKPFLRKYAAFYKTCVEYEYIFEYEKRLKRVKELIKEVGEIDVTPESDSAVDLTELFAKLVLRSSLPFLDVYIEEEKQNSTFVFQLTLPGKNLEFSERGRWSAVSDGQRRCLGLIRGELHGRNLDLGKIHDVYSNCLKNHSIYFNSIENAVRALGVFSKLHTYNQTQRIQELRFTIEWNVFDLITFDLLNVRKSLVYKKYKVLKIFDLQKNFPLLDWKRFFELLSGKKINENLSVHVYCIEYFKNLFQELRKTSKRKLINALIAMYARDLFENLVVTQTRNSREDYCLKLSSYLFPDVSSLLYAKTWSPKSKDLTEKFFAKVFLELKHNFSRTLNTVEWLDDATKTAALLKIQNLNIAFTKDEDNYNNENYMEEKYSQLNLTSTDFIGNFVQTDLLRKKTLYQLEGRKFSSNLIWGHLINSFDTKPLTVYSKRITIFPPGVLRKFDVTLPSYLTKAQVGMALAREIGQHFDSVGRHYGLKMKGTQNLTYTAMETFMKNVLLKELTRSLGKQTFKLKIDPELSIKDRIAENTGFRLVSEHLENLDQEPLLPFIMKVFSREKIFFIAVAQEYCTQIGPYKYMREAYESETLPAPMRVENIVSNSEIFSTTFGCPEGSKMNDNPAKYQFPYLTKSEDYAYYEN